jgi:hypothetical protein
MTEEQIKPTELVAITSIKMNPNNPRIIRDEKFAKLVQSIKGFPQMLNIRPIVVNDDMIVLGGNMRLKACKEAGLKQVPIIKASELTEEQEREFIIKDNLGFGDWDWQMIAADWNAEQLEEWGVDGIPTLNEIDLNDFFEENEAKAKEESFVIKLEYSEEDYNTIIEKFKQHNGTREDVVFRLLTAANK